MKHPVCFLLSLILIFSLVFFTPARAEQADPLAIDPTTLQIEAVKDQDTPGASFGITPQISGLLRITFSVDNLKEISGSSVQPLSAPGAFTFSPAEITAPAPNIRQVVNLTVGSVSDPGVWVGQVTLQYQGVITGTQTIPLTITLHTMPVLQVEAPAKIVVRGDHSQTKIERTVSLLETGKGSPAIGLAFTPLPLTNAENTAEFPPQNLAAAIKGANTIEGGGRGEVTLTFNLKKVPSGSYSGNLAISSENASEVTIPVEIAVKDPPLLPLLALVLGVLAGVSLTIYRETVLPRDLLRVRVKDMRTHYAEDDQFKHYCADQRVEPLLLQSEELVRLNKNDQAKAKLEEAEKIWDDWNDPAKHSTLRICIDRMEELIKNIDEAEADLKSLPPVQALRTQVNTILEHEIPDYLSKLEELRTKVTDPGSGWYAVWAKCQEISKLLGTVRPQLTEAGSAGIFEVDQIPVYERRLQEIESKCNALQQVPTVSELEPTSTELKTLLSDLEGAAQAVKQVRASFTAYQEATHSLLSQAWTIPTLQTTNEFIKHNGYAAAETLEKQQHWQQALERAQTGWWAAQVYRELNRAFPKILAGLSSENAPAASPEHTPDTPWSQAGLAARNWQNSLHLSSNFELSPEEFKNEIIVRGTALKEKIEGASQEPYSIQWDKLPIITRKAIEEGALADDSLSGKGREAELPFIPPSGTPGKPGARYIWDAAFWTPEHRIWLLHLVTFVIGVGFLVMVGYKELYADIHTFGENGWWDYIKMILWGFGAEAGRAEVVSLVTTWGVLTPRKD